MNSFKEIVEIIKKEKNFKYDADVERALGITQIGVKLSRNTIPFDELLTFCNKVGWSLNWLLAGEGPKTREPESAEGIAEDDQKLIDIVRILKSDSSVREVIYEILDQDKANSRVANTVQRFLARRLEFSAKYPGKGGNGS